MVETPAASWLPAKERFPVNMGPSFTRTMKLRKNEPPPNARHERHYHAVRCSFKPAAVNIAKPGAVEFTKKEDKRFVQVERASQTNDEAYLFKGTDDPARDLDYILIFDEDTKTFTLEKLDSVMSIQFDKKIPKEQRAAGSPMSSGQSTSAPSPDSIPLAQSTAKKQSVRMAAEQREAEARGADSKARVLKASEDAVKKPVGTKVNLEKAAQLAFRKTKKPAPPPSTRKEEGEASEGEIVESPRIAPQPARGGPPAATSTSQPAKVAPSRKTVAERAAERRAAAAAAAAAQANAAVPGLPPVPSLPAKPPAPTTLSQKVSTPTVNNKRPARDDPPSKPSPPKRVKASPPPTRTPLPKVNKEEPKPKPKLKEKKPVDLAFPGGGPEFALPSALAAPAPKPASIAFPGTSAAAPSLPSASHQVTADVDSEEEEWDDVIAPDATAVPPPITLSLPGPSRTITMEEIEPEPTVHHEEPEDEVEIDLDMFTQEATRYEQEKDIHMDDDDDFLTQALNDKDLVGDEDEEEDFLTAAISSAPESQPMPSDRRPLSMGDLMGAQGGDNEDEGGLWGGDDDDSSSSDDSDDD